MIWRLEPAFSFLDLPSTLDFTDACHSLVPFHFGTQALVLGMFSRQLHLPWALSRFGFGVR